MKYVHKGTQESSTTQLPKGKAHGVNEVTPYTTKSQKIIIQQTARGSTQAGSWGTEQGSYRADMVREPHTKDIP